MSESIDYVDNNSSTLLVIFGGIHQGIGVPQYEFQKSLKIVLSDKLFIKDNKQCWYQKGVKGYESIACLESFLRSFIEEKKYKKIVFIGNSMGGYISILLGVKLNIDAVIAFSPQSFIGVLKKIWNSDFRWLKQSIKANLSPKAILDLKNELKSYKSVTKIQIYYGNKHLKDSLHSERLGCLPNMELIPIESKNHNIVRQLRDNNKLIPIIAQKINEK